MTNIVRAQETEFSDGNTLERRRLNLDRWQTQLPHTMNLDHIILLPIVLTLSCCSTSTPVMSAGGGQYVISQSGTTGFTPLGPLRSGAYKKANRFAASKGGMAEIISVNETPAGFAVWPKVDVKFRVSHEGRSPDGLHPVEREITHSAFDATGRNTDTVRTIER
jgi:hypothetical protein